MAGRRSPKPKHSPNKIPVLADVEILDEVEVLDDVQVMHDVEVLDDIEVLDTARRKPTSSKKKRKPGQVYDDVEILDDVDDLDEPEPYTDDWLDLPDGYEDGPTVARAKKPKKKRKPAFEAPTTRSRPLASNHRDDDSDYNAGIFGGLGLMGLAVILFVVAYQNGYIWKLPIWMFIIGLGSFVKGLVG